MLNEYQKFSGNPLDWRKDPVQTKIMFQKSFNILAKKDYSGISPNVFVGRFGYPKVNVGFLSTQEIYENNDNVPFWVKEQYPINKIIGLRTHLINSVFKADIKSFNDRFLQMSQEVAMAQKPVDMEISLAKKPVFSLSFNQEAAPHGPKVELEKAMLTGNPRIPLPVEKVVSDTDLKSVEALKYLAGKGFDEYSMVKLLSIGTLGLKKNRRLVPTRWSITAVDDTLGKKLIAQVKDMEVVSSFTVFYGSHLGNYYIVLLCPNMWSYELFEMYFKSPRYTTDHESFFGRKGYAENTAGGYYSVRLGILEGLSAMKIQGAAFVLRFITDEYFAPLGVWVTREAARKAMQNRIKECSTLKEALDFILEFAKNRFNYDASPQIRKSVLLNEIMAQKRLSEY
ncbi:MAG: hypothetical protein V1659_01680 [Candidatus Woesearchaeota archaeon]